MAAFSAFEELSNRKAADVYRLILYSMCRPGEAAYVCAEDILVSNGERVWRMYGKNGKEFLVPLLGPIGEILNRRCLEAGGRGPLFWARDIRHTYPQPLREANAEFRRLSGLENVRPHDFRRTGRTHVPALGVPESVAEALLNHVKDEIEGTYNLYTYWRSARRHWGSGMIGWPVWRVRLISGRLSDSGRWQRARLPLPSALSSFHCYDPSVDKAKRSPSLASALPRFGICSAHTECIEFFLTGASRTRPESLIDSPRRDPTSASGRKRRIIPASSTTRSHFMD